MPAPFWPLDQQLLLPLGRLPPRRLLVSPNEDGPPDSRLRNRAAPAMLNGSLRLLGSEYDVLFAWGEGILTYWSLPFRWHDPHDGQVRTMQFNGEPGECTVEGAAGGNYDPTKNTWVVPVSLVVID